MSRGFEEMLVRLGLHAARAALKGATPLGGIVRPEFLAGPFAAGDDALATDRRVLLRLDGLAAPLGLPAGPSGLAAAMREILADGDASWLGTLTPEALADWAGPYEPVKDAEGYLEEPKQRPALVGDGLFDRALLAKASGAIAPAAGGTVRVGVRAARHAASHVLLLAGDGWRAAVMGMLPGCSPPGEETRPPLTQEGGHDG